MLLLTEQGFGDCRTGLDYGTKAIALAVNEFWGIDKGSFQLYRYVKNKEEG